MSFLIRMALSCLIVVKVCQETGPWTGCTIALLILADEANTYLIKQLKSNAK